MFFNKLSQDEVDDHVGHEYFIRGRSYFSHGHVLRIEQSKNKIVGLVQGSNPLPYQVEIYLENDEISYSLCSCPMGGECKHVAAVGLKAALMSGKQQREIGGWQERIDVICDLKNNSNAKKYFDLQILFKIEEKAPFFNSPATKALYLKPRIIDPVDQKVSTAMIGWRSGEQTIYWDRKVGFLKPEAQFYLKLLGEVVAFYASNSWADVDGRNVRGVWELLMLHEKYGVTLANAKIEQDKIIEMMTVSENGNNFTVIPKLYKNEEKFNFADNFLVGDPPVFAVNFTGLDLTLNSVEARFSTGFTPMIIPGEKADAFIQKYLPKLIRKFPVISSTPKIIIPKIEEIKPTLLISKLGSDSIEISVKAETDEIENKIKQKYPNIFDNGSFFGVRAARFIAEGVPKIKTEENLNVEIDPDLPKFFKDENPAQIEYKILENKDSNDWFDLNISVKISGEEIPFAELFTAIFNGEEYFLLENGRYFSLNNPNLLKLRELILESKNLEDKNKNNLKISKFQISFFEELEKLGIIAEQAKKWQEAIKILKNISKIDQLETPKNLKAVLRDYQKDGFSYLNFLQQNKLGGILADDMGLGKTVQTISLFAHAKGKNLVIAPTSVVENWDLELEKFAPHFNKIIFRAGDRSEHFKNLKNADVVVTSYALLVRDFENLKDFKFDTVIIDEAQMAKNHQSKIYSFIKKLNSPVKIALTGTPMENNLLELWAMFSLTSPGLFGDVENFAQNFRRPIEKLNDKEALEKLRARIKPFILRRKKELVEKELPAKTIQTVFLEMDQKHRALYDLHLQKEREKVLRLLESGGFKTNRFAILESLTKMRRLCLHPRLIDEKHKNILGVKVESLGEHLETVAAEGNKILVFSQFTSFLAIVREQLDKDKYSYLYLDGSTKNRGELVKKFQEGPDKIFLISLKAGGFGLNLTAANYCILLDPWWNPAVEKQAVDRTHRIGQTKPVFVYKFITKNTIEEKVLKLQEKKEKLFQNVMEDENIFGSMITEEDIKNIFS